MVVPADSLERAERMLLSILVPAANINAREYRDLAALNHQPTRNINLCNACEAKPLVKAAGIFVKTGCIPERQRPLNEKWFQPLNGCCRTGESQRQDCILSMIFVDDRSTT